MAVCSFGARNSGESHLHAGRVVRMEWWLSSKRVGVGSSYTMNWSLFIYSNMQCWGAGWMAGNLDTDLGVDVTSLHHEWGRLALERLQATLYEYADGQWWPSSGEKQVTPDCYVGRTLVVRDEGASGLDIYNGGTLITSSWARSCSKALEGP
jgi:hypothetical protein